MSGKVRARLTLAAGIVAGMAVLGLCFGALYWLLLPQHFPLTRVDLKGTVLRTTTAELEAALPRASGNFFAADLGEIRARVERLPWVRHVAVRRVWPGRLEISIEEHVALARWGDEALVNTHGERFVGKTQEALPSFIGPAGTQAEVARRYARFSAIVAPRQWPAPGARARSGGGGAAPEELRRRLPGDAVGGRPALRVRRPALPERLRGARAGPEELRCPKKTRTSSWPWTSELPKWRAWSASSGPTACSACSAWAATSRRASRRAWW